MHHTVLILTGFIIAVHVKNEFPIPSFNRIFFITQNAQLYSVLYRSRGYLEQHADDLMEAFDIAITCYALHLSGSPKAIAVMRKLNQRHSQCTDSIILPTQGVCDPSHFS